MNYRGWERIAKFMKHLIGCLTLLAVLVLLFMAIRGISAPTEVHAQTQSPTSQFVGHWCGNDTNGAHYMVLDVEDQPEGATYSSGTRNQEVCDIGHPTKDVLDLWCGNHFQIYAQIEKSVLRADWEEKNAPATTGVSYLQDCSY